MRTATLADNKTRDGLMATMRKANSIEVGSSAWYRDGVGIHSLVLDEGVELIRNGISEHLPIEQPDQRVYTQSIGHQENNTSSSNYFLPTINVGYIQKISKSVQDTHNVLVRREQFSSIFMSLQEQSFTESAERINELANLQDFEEGEKPLSLESVRNFQQFIGDFTVLGEPTLGIFSEGTLSAGWRLADNKHLLLEFLENNEISFAMIGPDDDATDGKFRLNGRGRKKRVLESLNNNNIPQWPE